MMSSFHVAVAVVWCVLVSLFSVAHGYGSGAPNRACVTMTPRHPGTSPDTTDPPYAIRVDQDSYSPGQRLTVTIYATCSGESFQGFIIQARRVDINANREQPIGTFSTPLGSRVVIGCGEFGQAITHNSQDPKTTLTFEWDAPARAEGDLVFVTTFLKEYTTYWPTVKSRIIRDTTSSTRADPGTESHPTQSRCPPPSPPTQQPVTTTTTTLAPTTTTTTMPPTTTTEQPTSSPQTQTPLPRTTTTTMPPTTTQSTTTSGPRTLPSLTLTPTKPTPESRTVTPATAAAKPTTSKTTSDPEEKIVDSDVSLPTPNSLLIVFLLTIVHAMIAFFYAQ